MATPEVTTDASDVESDGAPADGDAEVEMVQTDVGETGADPEGFFDGVDTDTGNDVAGDLFDGLDDADGSDGSSSDSKQEAQATRSSGLAGDINAGVARAAVIGLEDEWTTPSGVEKSKTDLQTEFQETFEAFRLGHYGAIVAEEYLLMEADDIHPVWGLVGAMLLCSAVIVYKRPDGEQIIEKTKLKLGSTDLSAVRAKLTNDDDDE